MRKLQPGVVYDLYVAKVVTHPELGIMTSLPVHGLQNGRLAAELGAFGWSAQQTTAPTVVPRASMQVRGIWSDALSVAWTSPALLPNMRLDGYMLYYGTNRLNRTTCVDDPRGVIFNATGGSNGANLGSFPQHF